MGLGGGSRDVRKKLLGKGSQREAKLVTRRYPVTVGRSTLGNVGRSQRVCDFVCACVCVCVCVCKLTKALHISPAR